MKISLKSQSKATLAGLAGLLIPMLLLKYYAFGVYENSVILLAVGIASVSGYYEGAKVSQCDHVDTKCDSCDIGPEGHAYDCPEAQE